MAVDLFFIISGFIFFWLYRDKLAARELSLLDFGVFRFSRLYPLHFATLIAVALLQFAFMKTTGQFFVYPSNDLKHFVESLFFIQQGGDRSGFNGPEWSLTIEIMMYAAFCVLARFGILKHAISSVAIVAFGLLIYNIHGDTARGVCGFFVGGLTFDVFEVVRRSRSARICAAMLAAVTAAGWSAIVGDIYGGGAVSAFLVRAVPFMTRDVLNLIVLYGLFPITALTIALHEVLFGGRYGALAWLGEISYSSYLLHFPLQLALALVAVCGLLAPETIRSPLGMLAYIAVLIPLSLLVFRLFEIPVQTALRTKWAGLGFGRAPRGLEPLGDDHPC